MAVRKNGSLRDAVTWKNVHGLLLVQEVFFFFFFFTMMQSETNKKSNKY